MILETTNVIMNLDELIRNDRDWSVSRICWIITPIYIKFENIIELHLRRLFFIKIIYSDNHIAAEGAKYLANSLQYNSSLLVLNLKCFLSV